LPWETTQIGTPPTRSGNVLASLTGNMAGEPFVDGFRTNFVCKRSGAVRFSGSIEEDHPRTESIVRFLGLSSFREPLWAARATMLRSRREKSDVLVLRARHPTICRPERRRWSVRARSKAVLAIISILEMAVFQLLDNADDFGPQRVNAKTRTEHVLCTRYLSAPR